MFDRVVVETIACEKDADASLHAEIFGADLIELRDAPRASSTFPNFK